VPGLPPKVYAYESEGQGLIATITYLLCFYQAPVNKLFPATSIFWAQQKLRKCDMPYLMLPAENLCTIAHAGHLLETTNDHKLESFSIGLEFRYTSINSLRCSVLAEKCK